MPWWLVEIGTPNGFRSHAFPGSSPGWGTKSFRIGAATLITALKVAVSFGQ